VCDFPRPRARLGTFSKCTPVLDRPDVTDSTPSIARAYAPGSIGNVACGFDVFGVALEAPGDEVVARRVAGSGIVSVAVTGDDGRIPRDPARNSAAVAGAAVLRRLGSDTGVTLEVRKGLPLSGGMGGSAASAVAGAVAVHALLGGDLTEEDLFACALEGEAGGSGAASPDNAAASLAGGIVLVPPGEPLRIVHLPVPAGLTAVVVHPHLEIRTEDARRLLGDTISIRAGVTQWGNTAGLVAGLYEEDWSLIARSLVDVVAEPPRSTLVPGFAAVKEAGMAAGALGISLSGSGPSMFALTRGRAVAESVGTAMVEAFRTAGGVEADLTVSSVARGGARIVEPASAGGAGASQGAEPGSRKGPHPAEGGSRP